MQPQYKFWIPGVELCVAAIYIILLKNLTNYCRTFKTQLPLPKQIFEDVINSVYGECTTSHRTNCPQMFCEKIFYLYVSFLSLFTIKIVSQKLVILHGLSQKLVTGFFPTVSFMTDTKSFFLQRSHTRTFSFSVSLVVCLFPLLSVLV